MKEDEFQRIVLEKLTTMDQRMSTMEQKMVTRDDILRLEDKIDKLSNDSPNDIMALLELIDNKLDNTATKEDLVSTNSIIKILSTRSIQQEAEIERIRLAVK